MRSQFKIKAIPVAIAWALVTVGAFDMLNFYVLSGLVAVAITHLLLGSAYLFLSWKGRDPEMGLAGLIFRILLYVVLLAGSQLLFFWLVLLDFDLFPRESYLIMLGVLALVLVLEGIAMRKLKKGRIGNWIHAIAFVLSVPLLFTTALFHVNLLDYQPPVSYAENHEISLQMFKGMKKPGDNLEGSSRFAFITTNIEYEIKDKEVVVESFFHPSRSYVFLPDLRDRFLLKHETYHFHISEYWSRVMKKRLSQFDSMPSRPMIEMEYEQVIWELYQMQSDYDRQSAHGYILGQQKAWEEKIDSLLLKLEAYAGPRISFD